MQHAHTATDEIWKPVLGFEGLYEVSNLVRIRSIERTVYRRKGGAVTWPEKVLKQRLNPNGYWIVSLWLNGNQKIARVHRLYALAFLPNPEGKPDINHRDGVKSNNSPSNLEWCTKRENSLHAYSTGLLPKVPTMRGERSPTAILTEQEALAIRRSTKVARLLAAEFKVSIFTIYSIRQGRLWRHLAK